MSTSISLLRTELCAEIVSFLDMNVDQERAMIFLLPFRLLEKEKHLVKTRWQKHTKGTVVLDEADTMFLVNDKYLVRSQGFAKMIIQVDAQGYEITRRYQRGFLHSMVQPAVHFASPGGSNQYWQYGKLHSINDVPAFSYNRCQYLSWYRDGLLHRTTGPAVIRCSHNFMDIHHHCLFSHELCYLSLEWWIDGVMKTNLLNVKRSSIFLNMSYDKLTSQSKT